MRTHSSLSVVGKTMDRDFLLPLKPGCYLTRNGKVAVVTYADTIMASGHVWVDQHQAALCEWLSLTGVASKRRSYWDIVGDATVPEQRESGGEKG